MGTTDGSVNVAQTISKSMTVGAMSICQRMPIGVAEAISISVPKTMAIGVPKTMAVVTVEGVCVSLGLSHSGGVGLGLGLPLVGQVVKSQNLSTGSIQRRVVKCKVNIVEVHRSKKMLKPCGSSRFCAGWSSTGRTCHSWACT